MVPLKALQVVWLVNHSQKRGRPPHLLDLALVDTLLRVKVHIFKFFLFLRGSVSLHDCLMRMASFSDQN